VLSACEHDDFTERFECHVIPEGTLKERWLEHWIQPIHDGMYAGGRIGYYSDITQRKLIETAEREQSNALAALEERQRIARELHDSVSQTLFTSSVIAESALRQWETNPQKARNLVEQLHQLTHSALAEMRVLLMELRPASLTRVQFKQLIEQLMRSLSTRRLLETEISVEDVPVLPPDVQIALYRILQEALNNVVKHAGASRVAIRSWLNDSSLHLLIEDDGCGFDLNTVGGSSLGLNIMRERAEGVNAKLDVHSDKGQGTRVVVTWPIIGNGVGDKNE
jgi:signal transduction histidine kinase